MYTLYERYYGDVVKIEVKVLDSSREIVKTEVLYHTGSYWKEHLSLGVVMGDFVVGNSTCFNNRLGWKMLNHISEAQAEAFLVHGKDFSTARFCFDLQEVK